MLSTTEINTLPFHIVRALCDAWACRNNTGFGDPGELGWIGEFDETHPDWYRWYEYRKGTFWDWWLRHYWDTRPAPAPYYNPVYCTTTITDRLNTIGTIASIARNNDEADEAYARRMLASFNAGEES